MAVKLIWRAKTKYFFRQDYASRIYLRQTYASRRGDPKGKATSRDLIHAVVAGCFGSSREADRNITHWKIGKRGKGIIAIIAF